MTSATSSLEVGGSVGGYRLERRLGYGATGTVYLATDADGRQVALKVVAPELARPARFRERLVGDCELLAGLEHPSLLPVYEAREAGGALFVAMQFVEGADLDTVLRDGPLPGEQAVSIVEQIAGALHAAHSCGVVHRDLKPSNVLLEARTHRAFVTDFGLVGRTDEYASPERVKGKRLDGRADVYSLGSVLAACLRGALWPEMERVVAKARAKDPEERYTTAVELAKAARRALSSMPAPVAPPPVASTVVEEEPEPPAQEPSKNRRRNLVVACVALLVVAGAAAGLVASLGGGRTATTSPPFAPGAAGAVAGTLGAVEGALSTVPIPPIPARPLYDTVANTGGVGVRYRSSPDLWCGGRPQTDPCWRTVIAGTGAAEGRQLRIYCYAPGASVHGDTWWAKVSVDPLEYVPAAFLRSAARYSSIAPPTSLRC